MDLTWSLYFPLILAAAAYAILSAAAGVIAGRGNEPTAERLRDAAFVIVLLGGAWVLVLLLLSVISQPDDLWDMVVITLVIVAFFAILLLVLFGLSLLVGRLSRSASRRRRVTTDKL
ncbi:MAG: hypothetical protein QOD71_2203 [Thermoleophilaceae bacterium]|jgi:hypothetical protein|nr:hypothetical protein [Thermoleophilaceae bacterium]